MEPLNKEKRIKREIANSNERRRMQSINAGFQKLKRLLPVNDGEKISKANILQHAADFITNIERDRIMLAEQNTLLRRLLLDLKAGKIDLDSALTPGVESPTPNSMLSVPLKLTMADLDSRDSSSPESTSTPTPSTTPTQLEVAAAAATQQPPQQQALASRLNAAPITVPQSRHRTSHARAKQYNNNNNSNNNNNNNNNNNDNNNTNTAPATTTIAHTTAAPHHVTSAHTYSRSSGNSGGLIQSNVDNNMQNIGSVAEIISDKIASPKNGLQTPGAAKAAIALPLEVPYTSEVIIKSSSTTTHSQHHHLPPHQQQATGPHQQQQQQHHHHQRPSDDFEAELMTGPRKLLKTNQPLSVQPSGLDSDDGGGASKGQNLDTICKAIMKIEGDRVFKNEKIE